MHHVKSEPRNQMQIFCLDQMVDPNSFVRIIDFFVDTIDLKSFGFKHVTLQQEKKRLILSTFIASEFFNTVFQQ